MKSNNQINVPQAKDAMDKFKMQAANEVGVNLKEGYNGDLTSREAGSVGGQMVKKCIPERKAHTPLPTKVHRFSRNSRILPGYSQQITYLAEIVPQAVTSSFV